MSRPTASLIYSPLPSDVWTKTEKLNQSEKCFCCLRVGEGNSLQSLFTLYQTVLLQTIFSMWHGALVLLLPGWMKMFPKTYEIFNAKMGITFWWIYFSLDEFLCKNFLSFKIKCYAKISRGNCRIADTRVRGNVKLINKLVDCFSEMFFSGFSFHIIFREFDEILNLVLINNMVDYFPDNCFSHYL